VHKPSINSLTSLTDKLSNQNTPDLMNNNSNNIRARAASSGLMMLQQYRWIYWWLYNIKLSYSYHTAYLTMKFTNLLSQIKHFHVKVRKHFISSSY